MSRNVLFICTGNTCRSAMAVYLAAAIAEKDFPDLGFCFDSAGLAAATGCPPSREALLVLGEKGLDMKNHKSKDFAKPMLKRCDYVITMTQGHKLSMLRDCPEASDKIFTLGELSGSGKDVPDPFCGSVEVYRKTADSLEREIAAALATLAKKE